jgi:hypothetical protein
MSNLAIVLPCLSVKNRVEDVDTVEPLYKHTIGNRICMLIREVCLCRGTVLAQLKNWDPNLNAYRSGMLM